MTISDDIHNEARIERLEAALATATAQLAEARELLREAWPHIGNEYARKWPTDSKFDAMMSRIAAFLRTKPKT